jgi:hypothetical protein
MTLSEIQDQCSTVQNFRGVYLRDNLPTAPWSTEIGILNLDSIENSGTHWTLYHKNDEKCYYFDSFGHRPPSELMQYFQTDCWYSTFQLQDIGTKYCGHLCVTLAHLLDELMDFPAAVYKLKELLEE